MNMKRKQTVASLLQTVSDSLNIDERRKTSSSENHYTTFSSVKGFDGKKFFTAGYVRGKTFYKEVTANQILYKPPAIAVQSTVLRKLENIGVDGVFVRNLDTKEVFYAPLSQFFEKGIKLNRGYGRQIALPLRYWVCVKER